MDGPIPQLGRRKVCNETHIIGHGKTGHLLRGVTSTAWMTLLMPCLLRGEGLLPEGPETAGFSLQVSMWNTGTPLNW